MEELRPNCNQITKDPIMTSKSDSNKLKVKWKSVEKRNDLELLDLNKYTIPWQKRSDVIQMKCDQHQMKLTISCRFDVYPEDLHWELIWWNWMKMKGQLRPYDMTKYVNGRNFGQKSPSMTPNKYDQQITKMVLKYTESLIKFVENCGRSSGHNNCQIYR